MDRSFLSYKKIKHEDKEETPLLSSPAWIPEGPDKAQRLPPDPQDWPQASSKASRLVTS